MMLSYLNLGFVSPKFLASLAYSEVGLFNPNADPGLLFLKAFPESYKFGKTQSSISSDH